MTLTSNWRCFYVVPESLPFSLSGGRVLVSGLSFKLGESERMLIVGESGAGKSSLLRAMAGLWTTG